MKITFKKIKRTIMKKKLITLTAVLFTAIVIFSCKKETANPVEQLSDDEKYAPTEELSTIESNDGFKSAATANICCFTPATNIVRDPEFLGIIPSNLYTLGPCNNLKKNTMTGYNTDWFAAPYGGNTPQVGVVNCNTLGLAMGACNRGYIHFWGNKKYGESITQDNQAFLPTQSYIVQFNARIRPGNIGSARLALRLSNAIASSNIRTISGAAYSPNTYTSTVISDSTWRCYKFQFTDSTSAYKVLNLFPVNQFATPFNFSRLDIDDVKIW
jgi:hypothetical protein